MFRNRIRSANLACMIIVAAGFIVSSYASGKSGGFDYSHRKRDCNITVKSDGEALSGAAISVKQIRNHFGFGASINRWAFDTLGEGYGQAFLKYFDYGTPENEMKWEYVHKQDTINKTDPNYARADYLVEFLQKNDILIRGHNLFWNEKKDWLPKWTWTLNSADFKTAMQERINSAMTYFKGKVVQWDVINEIIHGPNGATPSTTMLDSITGDPNIFSWILDEARMIDPVSKFVINDYNLIEGDQGSKFIAKCKPLGSKFDVIGCEGHFGGTVDKASYESKINNLAQQLGKKVWLTEVDFTITSNQAAKVEELMRSCFANQNVEGLIIWVWCKRRMWLANATSYFVDSTLQETAVGKKWREVRAEWKTNDSGTTDANGKFSFNGFQGKYRLTVTSGGVVRSDTFYLEPGTGAKSIEISPTGIFTAGPSRLETIPFQLNGQTIHLTIPPGEDRRLYLSTYSLAGKVLSRTPVAIDKGTCSVTTQPSGCHIFRIGTADRVLYTGLGLQLR